MYRQEDKQRYNFPPKQPHQAQFAQNDPLQHELQKLRQENEQWRAWYAQNGGNNDPKAKPQKKGKTNSQPKATNKEADEASKMLAVIFITAVVMAFLYIVFSPKNVPDRVDKTEKRR